MNALNGGDFILLVDDRYFKWRYENCKFAMIIEILGLPCRRRLQHGFGD